MRIENAFNRWRDNHAMRVLYVLAILSTALLLARLAGVIPGEWLSTDLLSGFVVGLWLSLLVAFFSGTRANQG